MHREKQTYAGSNGGALVRDKVEDQRLRCVHYRHGEAAHYICGISKFLGWRLYLPPISRMSGPEMLTARCTHHPYAAQHATRNTRRMGTSRIRAYIFSRVEFIIYLNVLTFSIGNKSSWAGSGRVVKFLDDKIPVFTRW